MSVVNKIVYKVIHFVYGMLLKLINTISAKLLACYTVANESRFSKYKFIKTVLNKLHPTYVLVLSIVALNAGKLYKKLCETRKSIERSASA
jgi:hypothetical protein